ncbi:MAG: hypothetical protein H0W81_08530 [Chloroflexi bacterium]|nr:hypothetical protein [Chloroflexota bacterium]
MIAVVGCQNLWGHHTGCSTSQDECRSADGNGTQVSASGWQVSDHASSASRINLLHDGFWGCTAATEDHHGAIEGDASGVVNWHRQLAQSANLACTRIKRKNLTRRRAG